MKTFEAGDLKVEVKVVAGLVRLTWLGQSNVRDPGTVLRPLFDEIAALLTKERAVELDFRDFDYMNSSTPELTLSVNEP